MYSQENRFDCDLEYQGKQFRLSSCHVEVPGGDRYRRIDLFDSDGLYGFIEIPQDSGLKGADAYARVPGKEGLQKTDPLEFKEIYEHLSGVEEAWDADLEVENPRDTAEPYKKH